MSKPDSHSVLDAVSIDDRLAISSDVYLAMTSQLSETQSMLDWLLASGGTFHPSLTVNNGTSDTTSSSIPCSSESDETTGLSVFSTSNILPKEALVSCPIEVAITPELATQAICEVTGIRGEEMEEWNERMRICAYISLHSAFNDRPYVSVSSLSIYSDAQNRPVLAHRAYIDSLLPSSAPLTPLYFTSAELQLLGGTNLAGAVEEQRRKWQSESERVRRMLRLDGLTWYLRFSCIAKQDADRCRAGIDISLPQLTSPPAHSLQSSSVIPLRKLAQVLIRLMKERYPIQSCYQV